MQTFQYFRIYQILLYPTCQLAQVCFLFCRGQSFMNMLHQSCEHAALSCFEQLPPFSFCCTLKGKIILPHTVTESAPFTSQLHVFTVWTVFWSHWQEGRTSKVSSLLTLAEMTTHILSSLFPVSFGWRYWSIKEHQGHARPQKLLGLLHPFKAYLRPTCICISNLLPWILSVWLCTSVTITNYCTFISRRNVAWSFINSRDDKVRNFFCYVVVMHRFHLASGLLFY